jgi:hypothetical protein
MERKETQNKDQIRNKTTRGKKEDESFKKLINLENIYSVPLPISRPILYTEPNQHSILIIEFTVLMKRVKQIIIQG